jgi:hypothetical protein
MDFYNREVFGKMCAAAAATTQGPVPTPRTWEDEMLDALDNDNPTVPGPAAEVPTSSPVSRPAETQQSPSPPRSPEPDPKVIAASLDINATSRVSMQSVRPSSPLTTTSNVGLSAVAQLEVDVTQMSISSTGAKIAQAAPVPQSRRVSSRRAAPAAPAHPSQAAVQSGSSNEVTAGPALQPKRATRAAGRGKKN